MAPEEGAPVERGIGGGGEGAFDAGGESALAFAHAGDDGGLGEGGVPVLGEVGAGRAAGREFVFFLGREEVAGEEADFFREAVALEEDLVDFLDGEFLELGIAQGAGGKFEAGGLGDHSVDDDVGGDVPEEGVGGGAAFDMAEGGVEEFVDDDGELLVDRMAGHEGGIEEEAASIGGGGFHGLGDEVFGEEGEGSEERRDGAQVEDEQREVEGMGLGG